MLCALADFFDVTTDELLGRHKEKQLAVIATDSPELGKSVAQLVNRYGFTVREICSSIGDARNAVKAEPAIGHIFASFSRPLSEDEQEDIPKKTCVVEVHSDNGDVLDGFELYLKNMTTLASLVQK